MSQQHFQTLKTNPFFTSLAIISHRDATIWIQKSEQNNVIKSHLAKGNCVEEYTCINVRDYETVIEDIITWASANLIDEKVLITQATRMESGATYAVYEAIPEDNRLFGYSPLIYPRARKNPVELQGMLNAHVRDAIVLIEFLAFLERDVRKISYYKPHCIKIMSIPFINSD